MTTIARIDDEEVSALDFVKILKLNDKYDELIEEIMVDKLAVAAAKKQGLSVPTEEVQARADQIRRVLGLHRAKDTNEYLDSMGVSLDEFERHIVDGIYKEKIEAQVCTKQAIEDYFSLHSPKFDSLEIAHMVLDSEGKAREILALVEDDPDSFEELAREHSLDDETSDSGGYVGKVARGTMEAEVEAKLFNADPGDVIGPFTTNDGLIFEIFKITDKHPAKLDDATQKEVHKLIYDEWLETRSQEHRLEML